MLRVRRRGPRLALRGLGSGRPAAMQLAAVPISNGGILARPPPSLSPLGLPVSPINTNPDEQILEASYPPPMLQMEGPQLPELMVAPVYRRLARSCFGKL